jgi:hypothetical protein
LADATTNERIGSGRQCVGGGTNGAIGFGASVGGGTGSVFASKFGSGLGFPFRFGERFAN